MERTRQTGLHNYGFNCFMNSTLQCLKSLDSVRKEIYQDSSELDKEILLKLTEYNDKKPNDLEIVIDGVTKKIDDNLFKLYGVYYNLKNILCKLIENKDSKVDIGSFIMSCKKYGSNAHLFTGEQCDTQEFLIYLLDILHKAKEHNIDMQIPNGECNTLLDIINKDAMIKFKKEYGKKYSWIVREFGSMTLSIIKCNKCSYFVHPIEPILMTILQIPDEKNVTLYDCLDHFYGKDVLEDEESWKCDKCGNKDGNYKDGRMLDFPKCMVIVISRFSYRGNRWIKHKQLVDAPEVINLARYSIDKNCEDKKDAYTYELKSVSNHIGDVGGGHYYTHCKFNDHWYRMDDESCSSLDKDGIITNNAYVLFYEKVKK